MARRQVPALSAAVTVSPGRAVTASPGVAAFAIPWGGKSRRSLHGESLQMVALSEILKKEGS